MGQINVRKRGKVYEYFFEGAKVNNKRTRITKSGFKTKAEAQEAGTVAYEKYIRTGAILKECQMSYYDYLDFWYENYCKVNFKNRQMELRLLYGKDYHYYHFEEVKNQYGKVLEYQIVENPPNILSMKPAKWSRNKGCCRCTRT